MIPIMQSATLARSATSSPFVMLSLSKHRHQPERK